MKLKFTGFPMIVLLLAGTAASQTIDPVSQALDLGRMLESDNAEIRTHAVQYLRRVASPSLDNHYRRAIPTLIQTSTHEDRKLAAAATDILTAFGPSPWGVLKLLAASDTPLARSAFGRMLSVEVKAAIDQMDRRWPGPLVASRLLPFLHDSKVEVRHCATRCLGMLGKDAQPAVPVLLRVLRHGTDADRRQAAWALGMIGNRSKSVLEALSRLATTTRPWAGRALSRLRQTGAPRLAAKEALATLRRLLTSERARTLEVVKGEDSGLPSRIARILKERDWRRQEAAAMALRALHHR